MAHPFFERLRYPFGRDDGSRLFETLIDTISVPAQIDLLYKQCDATNNLDSLTPGNERLMWKEALESLAAHGLLQRLCELVQQRYPSNTLIQQAVADVINAQEANKLQIISDDLLILDRSKLRQYLKQIEPETTRVKVLLVRGDPLSGKSHGRYLFERAAEEQGAQPVYLCKETVATLKEALTLLFAALGESEDKIPPGDTSDEAWYKVVCSRLQVLAMKANKPLWIVADDLGPAPDKEPLIDPQIRNFFDQFALQMLSPVFRRWFRLMLIHYPDEIPARWKRDFWIADRTDSTDVKQSDVEELLRTWSAINKKNIVGLTKLAGEVLTKAEAPVPPGEEQAPRLQRIHDALTETLQNLAGSTT